MQDIYTCMWKERFLLFLTWEKRWLHKGRSRRRLSLEKRELFISTVSSWCLKSVAVLAKGAYRYSYWDAGVTLELHSQIPLRFTLLQPLFRACQSPSLSRWHGSVARSVIFQMAVKSTSKIKGLLNCEQKLVSLRFDQQWNLRCIRT